jgi:hypothetical protein
MHPKKYFRNLLFALYFDLSFSKGYSLMGFYCCWGCILLQNVTPELGRSPFFRRSAGNDHLLVG